MSCHAQISAQVLGVEFRSSHLHSKHPADWLSQAGSLGSGLIREGEVGLPVPTKLLHKALYPWS